MLRKNLDKFVFEDIQDIDDNNCNFKMVMYEKIKTPSGKTLFTRVGRNATTIGGTQKMASLLLKDNPNIGSGSYNTITTIDEAYNDFPAPTSSTTKNYLFGILFGKDGGNATNVEKVNRFSKGFDENQLIPMRQILLADESGKESNLRDIYGLRRTETIDGNTYAKYYLKKPMAVAFKNMTKAGSALPDNPNDYTGTEDVVSMLQFHVKIEIDPVNLKDDMSEHFIIEEGDINRRRFNSIMLCYGEEVLFGSKIDYRNIIVTNRINTLTRSLGKYGTGDYYFNVYFK